MYFVYGYFTNIAVSSARHRGEICGVFFMYRLMRIEKEKAKERMSEGGKGAVKSSDVGEAKDKTAEAFGIGRQTGRPEAFRSCFSSKGA